MPPSDLLRAFGARADPVRAGWFRGPREAVVMPLLEALGVPLKGARIVELGSGEPLLLAKALAARGAHVTAIDPALAHPAVEAWPVEIVASDALELSRSFEADLTLSTLFFGAPLRQRARRELRDAYLSGQPPDQAEVVRRHAGVERALIERLGRWTRPGGWTVHVSLEGLFACPWDVWRENGFEPLLLPGSASEVPETPSWAIRALSGTFVARRGADHDGRRGDRAECGG